MHLQAIDEELKAGTPHNEIVRKIYLTYPTAALSGKEDRQFTILNEISEFFDISIINVQVAGSSKAGYSFHKKTKFDHKNSDLDIAIIDPFLFQKYTEWVFKDSKGLLNRTVFDRQNGVSTYSEYVKCITKGFFRPDLMPAGQRRANWFKFFGQLSTKNKDLFKSVNAGIYFSQTFFEYKQIDNINEYILEKPI